MKTNRVLALAMAGAMMTGAFATAMPVLAEEITGTTTVSFTVEQKNTYTMTVPANTQLDAQGNITALTDGVKISSDNKMESDYAVNVTASSANGWKLKADGVSSEIGYTLYSDEAGTIEMDGNGTAKGYILEIEKDGSRTTTAAKGLWFTADEANSTTTKQVYAKADATDVEDGTYTDTITFTAETGEKVLATVADSSVTSTKYYYTALYGTTWGDIVPKTESIYDGKVVNDQSKEISICLDNGKKGDIKPKATEKLWTGTLQFDN